MLAAREVYEQLITPLRGVAARCGYALAQHGTLARDIDLIAVPWSMEAVDAHALAEAIRCEAESITGCTAFWFDDPKADPRDYTRRSPEPKPHGRLGWSIHIVGTGTYIDLSVTPRGGAFIDTHPAYPQETP